MLTPMRVNFFISKHGVANSRPNKIAVDLLPLQRNEADQEWRLCLFLL